MRKGLLLWVTALVLAFTMSFSTVLSFANPAEQDEESGDVVQNEQQIEDEVLDEAVPEEEVPDDVVLSIKESSDFTVDCAATCNFEGKAATPAVTVKDSNGATVASSEYTVAYSDNTKPTKSAKVTVTANDGASITGTVTKEFKIVAALSKYGKVQLSKTSFPVKFKKNDEWKVITVAQKPTVKVLDYDGNALKNGTDYTYTYSNSNSKDAGTYKVTVTAKNDSAYTGTVTATYKITPKKLDSNFYAWASEIPYTGKKVKPKKVLISYWDEKAKMDLDLVKNKHYTVTKAATFSNNKKIGYANIKITIKGKGNFTGTKVINGSFTVSPEKATIKSAKVTKKKVTVKWKKAKHADGYVIEYGGWNGKGKDTGWKKITVKSNKTVKKTIKNLKKGYTYDIFVYSYKKVKGDKVFAYDNPPKTIKVK